ncbi:MAG TPA: 2-keto-3-deoxygluconate permease [Planctomycetaceae bacterium]|nr:2-keto-3-deoxygluconate permease [Planctomycetaceae bacterium]
MATLLRQPSSVRIDAMLVWLKRLPGGLMIVPLLLGAILCTIDRAHLAVIEEVLRWLGASPIANADGRESYEFLQIGGFATALTGIGAPTLIAMFLVCVSAQMDFGVGRSAIKKGAIITTTKLLVAIACGYAIAVSSDRFHGWFGLSLVAVLAAMSNGNGGLYLALTGQYGDRSDVGAVSVISLNDGPFFTLLALGILGERFPMAAFLGVLFPMALGFALGQISDEVRRFLAPGEKLCIPFFAFALGTTINFGVFLDADVLLGGVILGVATAFLTGSICALALHLSGERSTIAGFAEGSTAGNAVQTPLAVAIASGNGMGADNPYIQILPTATGQIAISVILTAILCPLITAFMYSNPERKKRAS